MATVQRFGYDMIEQYLRSKGLKYMRDSDGDYRVLFSYESEIDCELTVLLIAGGRSKEIYNVLVWSSKRIPRGDWDRVIGLCNTWNRDRRWPKAYLFAREPSDATAEIRLEGQIDLEKGIHQELFDDFTDTVIATAFSFWKWAHEEQGL